MNRIIIVTGIAVALAGCEQIPFTPQHQIAAAKRSVAFQSTNPMTVRWEGVKRGDGRVCGYVNMEEAPSAWNDHKRAFSDPQPFVADGKGLVWIGAIGRCDFMTEFKVCHEGAERAPLESACKAEFARMKKDTEDQLRAAGLPVTGDANKDAEALANFAEAEADRAMKEATEAAAEASAAANEAYAASRSR